MKLSVIPPELKGKALLDFIVKNEALIIHTKKSAIKEADATITSSYLFVDEKGALVSKAISDAPTVSTDATKLLVDLCINTTNYFDSHCDVHIQGLWKKSLADNGKAGFYLLERHSQAFKDVIGEGLKGKAVKTAWKDLGFDYSGVTEALMFSGVIEKDRNPFMFEQYAKRRVKQHSVGMRYVKIVTCINHEDYPVQKENWDKYFPMVVNGDEAEECGFFWAVLEAKVNEGSAVLFGSNDCTPTQSVEEYTGKNKSESTLEKPDESTSNEPQFNLMEAIKRTQFC